MKIIFAEGEPLSFQLPLAMVFEVVIAPPGVRGNSATSATKPVTLANGLILQGPLFLKKGDRVKVDTRTGKYLERVK